jgi:hypothetical protein
MIAAQGASGMQNGYTTQAIDSSNELHLSAEEVALFEEMVNDSFLDATVSIADMKTAITDYAYQNWQA